MNTTIHASAVQVGPQAVLIRGPSGSGKSRLAFDLILAGRAGIISPTILIGDDRIHLDDRNGRLIACAVPELAGLIEIRGLGIRRCDYTDSGNITLVVDLAASDATRLPAKDALSVTIAGIAVRRVPVGVGYQALPLVLAALTTDAAELSHPLPNDCPQDIGNHIRPTIASFPSSTSRRPSDL